MKRGRTLIAALVAVAVVASACGSTGSGGGTGGTSTASATATATAVARPDVIVGSTNFYEQITLGELYSQILEANGYKVTRKFNLGNRELVEPAIESGQIDVDAEYLATLLAFVDKDGKIAKPTTDPKATQIGLQKALDPKGLTVLDYAAATDQNGFVAINVANVGRALPSLALLAFGLVIAISLGLGLGFWPTVFALVPLAIPPILTNSYVAIREVDRDIVEAARGMGLSEGQILRAIEVPLGLPLMLAGIRTAAVNVVATATLGALVAGGALGRFIVDGLALQEYDQLMAGALLVALLAVATEVSFAALERATVPAGMRAIR